MSDLDADFEPSRSTANEAVKTRKRKSTVASGTSTSKRARKGTTISQPASIDTQISALLTTILNNQASYVDPTNPQALGNVLVSVARYARQLENAVQAAQSSVGGSGAGGAKKKTPEELAVAADKLQRVVRSGIQKQMSWKPSCKTNSAKFTYDGICPDPEVFGHMLGLCGPPTWKMKKFTKEEFQDKIGQCSASIRYGSLHITSKDVNIRWSDTGEFKMTGSYGRGF